MSENLGERFLRAKWDAEEALSKVAAADHNLRVLKAKHKHLEKAAREIWTEIVYSNFLASPPKEKGE